MSHAAFGALLVKNWNLPNKIVTLIHHHHNRFASPPSKETATVYLANWLVDVIGIGFSGEKVMPKLDRNAWNALEITESILAPVVRQLDRQVRETIQFFYE